MIPFTKPCKHDIMNTWEKSYRDIQIIDLVLFISRVITDKLVI